MVDSRARIYWRLLKKEHYKRDGVHCSPFCQEARVLWMLGNHIGIDKEEMHGLAMVCRREPKCKIK